MRDIEQALRDMITGRRRRGLADDHEIITALLRLAQEFEMQLNVQNLDTLTCRFSERGCKSPPVAVIHAPDGCQCWRDPVQAVCAQHLMSCESVGPIHMLVDLRIERKP